MKRLVGRNPANGAGLAIDMDVGRIVAVFDVEYDGDQYISAGLVDLQINGYFGYDLNDHTLTPERVVALTHKLFESGVTTYQPTLITASEQSILSAIRAIVAACRADPRAALAIGGIHVEGPFLSPNDGPRGAHPVTEVRPPDLAELDRWQTEAEGLITMVTLSPHYASAPDFIKAAVARSIHIAIGHTDATPEQVHAAAAAGAVLSTHLGNGAAANLPRHPNFIWAQLADDRLSASFIADSHHLDADTLTAMMRAKGLDRSVLVSDLAAPGGLTPDIYDQPIGGRVQLWENGRLGTPGTPYLAGAATTLSDCVAMAAKMTGFSLAETLTMATRNAGRFLSNIGKLEVGARADIMLFKWQAGGSNLTITETYLAGERVW
jgi:N-acetylglucosamine-6-phosphate deacetylase